MGLQGSQFYLFTRKQMQSAKMDSLPVETQQHWGVSLTIPGIRFSLGQAHVKNCLTKQFCAVRMGPLGSQGLMWMWQWRIYTKILHACRSGVLVTRPMSDQCDSYLQWKPNVYLWLYLSESWTAKFQFWICSPGDSFSLFQSVLLCSSLSSLSLSFSLSRSCKLLRHFWPASGQNSVIISLTSLSLNLSLSLSISLCASLLQQTKSGITAWTNKTRKDLCSPRMGMEECDCFLGHPPSLFVSLSLALPSLFLCHFLPKRCNHAPISWLHYCRNQ